MTARQDDYGECELIPVKSVLIMSCETHRKGGRELASLGRNLIVRDRSYIDGRWLPSTGNGTIDVIDPPFEDVIGSVPDGTVEDVDRAARAAQRRRRLTFTNRSKWTATNTNRWNPRVYPRSSKSHDGMARPEL